MGVRHCEVQIPMRNNGCYGFKRYQIYLMGALQQLGVPELMITARLLGGVLESAMGAIESGSDPDAVTRTTIALVHAAVQPAGSLHS